jgi:crotonobetainyl-CoA:carnitine CoA-transferase CaiB-like acyl-CoA transferase
MALTGAAPDEPTRVGVPIADLLAGMYGATGVVSALYERERTGRGQVVRTSLLAAVVGVHAHQGTRWTVAGEVPVATGNHHPSIAPYGAFRAADQFVQISVGSQGLWRRFAPLVGIAPEDPRFAVNSDRVRHRDELVGLIEQAFGEHPAAHWLPLLADIGVPAGAVRTLDQVYAWEQTRSQGLLIETEHPTLGTIRLPGPPLRFDGAPAAQHAPPPTLGQHNDAVRAWLDELDELDRSSADDGG